MFEAGSIETFLHVRRSGRLARRVDRQSTRVIDHDRAQGIRIAVWAAVIVLGAAILWFAVFNKGNDGGGGIVAASIGGPFPCRSDRRAGDRGGVEERLSALLRFTFARTSVRRRLA
jgi:hypothetical protein